MIPYPQYLSKEEYANVQKALDIRIQYQREYGCVKQ
jgi:hypothetical protein